MNTPITWGDYFEYRLIAFVGMVILSVLMSLLVAASDGSYCKHCARRLQWRWSKPRQYSSRRFCPYHDDVAP